MNRVTKYLKLYCVDISNVLYYVMLICRGQSIALQNQLSPISRRIGSCIHNYV